MAEYGESSQLILHALPVGLTHKRRTGPIVSEHSGTLFNQKQLNQVRRFGPELESNTSPCKRGTKGALLFSSGGPSSDHLHLYHT